MNISIKIININKFYVYVYIYRGTFCTKLILEARANTKVDIQKYGLRFIYILSLYLYKYLLYIEVYIT